MTETTQPQRSSSGHGRTAVGRLTVLVEVDNGTEKVTYERRWSDADGARHWCETKVAQAPPGAVFLEIQVTEEVWGRRHSWEAMASRHIPETLQLGLWDRSGSVTWGDPRDVGNDLFDRRRR